MHMCPFPFCFCTVSLSTTTLQSLLNIQQAKIREKTKLKATTGGQVAEVRVLPCPAISRSLAVLRKMLTLMFLHTKSAKKAGVTPGKREAPPKVCCASNISCHASGFDSHKLLLSAQEDDTAKKAKKAKKAKTKVSYRSTMHLLFLLADINNKILAGRCGDLSCCHAAGRVKGACACPEEDHQGGKIFVCTQKLVHMLAAD